jgi:hypothetical protein
MSGKPTVALVNLRRRIRERPKVRDLAKNPRVASGCVRDGLSSERLSGGEGGIRTLDRLLTYTPLAGARFQPAQPPLRGGVSLPKMEISASLGACNCPENRGNLLVSGAS